MLLQHVLWQRPEEAARVADFVLNQLSEDDGVAQANYLFAGKSFHCLDNMDIPVVYSDSRK